MPHCFSIHVRFYNRMMQMGKKKEETKQNSDGRRGQKKTKKLACLKKGWLALGWLVYY